MSRIPYLTAAEMTERQRRRAHELEVSRGGPVSGPGAFWLYNPAISECAEPFRQHMEQGTSLPTALSELAILIAARHWSATYAWCRHEGRTVKAGINAAAVADLCHGRPPDFADEKANTVYALARMLLTTGGLDDPTYDRALSLFGLPALVELVSEVGYGSLVALANATFEPDAPPGAEDHLPLGPLPSIPAGWPSHAPRLDEPAFDISRDSLIAAALPAWSRCPPISSGASAYDEVLRRHLTLAPHCMWLIVLFVAGYWHARPLWPDLRRQASANGLGEQAVARLERMERPSDLDPQQAAAYEFARDLMLAGRPSDAVFATARATLGLTRMIEIAGLVGFMTMAALTANVFARADG